MALSHRVYWYWSFLHAVPVNALHTAKKVFPQVKIYNR
jgi:hypothetical protein